MKLLIFFILNVFSVGVIPMPQDIDMSDKVFDMAHIDNVRYVEDSFLSPEAYELIIRRKEIIIRSSSDAGRFYAHKTLDQLVSAGDMHQGVIKDEPEYEWRGFMLDEARHFFGKEKVKQVLDLMARYKMNRFHWHLSDSQGWRVEIKAYPQLCSVGGIGNYSDKNAPARYYTQEDIRDIVQYASERHIEIIPEIDMPGHARAMARAIPEIDGGRGTLNPGSEKAYEVIDTIIKELAELFPGRYLHIGGDEVDKTNWAKLPEVKKLMEEKSLSSLNQVQYYFGHRVADMVLAAGKEMIAWDDLLDSGITPEGKILQWWRRENSEYLYSGLDAGFRMIACPHFPLYLDYIQTRHHTLGHSKTKVHTLREVYQFELIDSPLILGIQCNLWTEDVRDARRLDFMLLPRLLALAETAWTKSASKDYDSFMYRLKQEYKYMDGLGLYYFDVNDPAHHPEPTYN